MDFDPGETLGKGKREAGDAIEIEVLSSKKQKVEETVSEIKTDTVEVEKEVEAETSCSKPEQWMKVNVSAEDGHAVSVLENKSNVLEENTSAAEKKSAVAIEEGHKAATLKNNDSTGDSDSLIQDETSMAEDIAATIRTPAIEEDPVAPPTKKDESSKDYDSCSKGETILDEDVIGANLSPPAQSMQKSLVSIQKKDDSWTGEFHSVHEGMTDDNVATAKTTPTETAALHACKKEDEPSNDTEEFAEFKCESIPLLLTKKETGSNGDLELDHETNDELELDYETSSSDDDPQTPASPTEKTTGSKTLFVGNLSFSIWKEDVEDFFKAAGEVVGIRFGMNSDETFKGYGYVEFASAEAAEKAFRELNGKELLHRRVRLDFEKARASFTPYNGQDAVSSQKVCKDQGHTVFVRGFNKADCQDEIRRSLEEHFGSCGEISRVSVPKDEDGCARGIAYIDFKDKDAFNRALALNGSAFREGTLSVIEAKPRGGSHDNAGIIRGYGRNGGRYSWRDFSGRRGVCEGGGGRSDWQNFSGRGDCEVGGGRRNDFRDFGGGRSNWQSFGGRRGVCEGGDGRSDWQNFCGRRGVYEGGGGRRVWRGFDGRSGVGETGSWSGSGVWRGRGVWQNFSGRGGLGSFSGRSNGWFGGGGSREQPTPNIIAAPAPAPGKREAEDAIQIEMVSAKKQKVEGKVSEIKNDPDEVKKVEADTSCSKPEQLIKVNVSAVDGRVVSLLEDKNNVEEDTSAAEKKPAVTSEEGHIVANSKNYESNDVSNSFFQDETGLVEDDVASIRAPAPLIGKATVSPSTKKDETCKDSDCFKDETILEEDVTGGNLSPPAPCMQKSLFSFQKKDDSQTYEFYSAHESNTDDNVTTAKTAPTKKGPLVSCEKKEESDNDNNKIDEDTAESIPLLSAKENGNNEELELDHQRKEELALDYENSSSNDDHQTPATPKEQTTGSKILFVGNLSLSIEKEDVEHFFKSAGEVQIRFGMNTDKTLKGYAHVEFASAEAAEKALHELNGKELLHRRVRLDFAKARASFTPYNGQDTESSQKGWKDQVKTLYVCGFRKADGQDEIRRSLEEHFGSCGEISRVSVPKGEDGCARGIAFIDFKDKDAFNRALTLNGSVFGENTLSVAEAKAKPRGDSRDNGGVFQGYARSGGRYGWQDFGGRRGGCEGGRRSDWQSSSGRSGWQNVSGRSSWHEFGLQNFSGRSSWHEYGGRSDLQNFSGRRGGYEGGGGVWRGGFSGRSGSWSGCGRGGFSGRSNTFGGGGSREQPTPDILAASGSSASLITQECVEDEMK